MDYHSLSMLVKDYFFSSSGHSLTNQDIIGLHLEKELLQYVCLTRTRKGWSLSSPSPALEPSGKIQESAPWSLKQFLEWLTVFPLVEGSVPTEKRSIYLGLPRNQFFARDLQLPPMPIEDALASVQNSLPVCCHLPLEEVYFDIHLCRATQGNINALIFYAPRKDMDVYLDIFRETGHLKSLRGLFPVSLGIGAWLNMQRYPMPIGIILPQDGIYELAIFHNKGCLYSGTWPLSEGEEGGRLLTAYAKSKFQGLGDNIFSMNNGGLPPPPSSLPSRLDKMPSVKENMGVAAAATALSGQQEISIDGNPPRLRIFQPLRLLVPVVLFVVLMCSILTSVVKWDMVRQKQKLSALTAEVQELKEKLGPLEKNRASLKDTNKLLEDAADFINTKPRLFSDINEVALALPGNTWFSHLNFQKGVMTFKGQSPDALQIIETLRSSGIFEQVNLNGSVSRDNTGAEKFSLVIKLKENEASE